ANATFAAAADAWRCLTASHTWGRPSFTAAHPWARFDRARSSFAAAADAWRSGRRAHRVAAGRGLHPIHAVRAAVRSVADQAGPQMRPGIQYQPTPMPKFQRP